MKKIVIATLYKFVSLPDCEVLQEQLLQVCVANQVKGSFLLAAEGINGTIAGSREGIDAVLAYLRSDERLADLTHQESFADEKFDVLLTPLVLIEVLSKSTEAYDRGLKFEHYQKPTGRHSPQG